jgi:hypothetical protein
MGARYYDAALGRFISADTIIASLANPQSLNRYAYGLNNPVKYTDPSGYFSEDEIMKALGVKTWKEVLAFFEKGGALEGRWGWLEVLRRAEIGDRIDIQWDSAIPLPEGHLSVGESFTGWFTKDDEGHLLIGNKDLGDFFDQMKAGKYGQQYDLTHYERQGLLYEMACAPYPCSATHFSTLAIHDPYYHTKVKWSNFIEKPIATMELVTQGAITVFTAGLTVVEGVAVTAACSNPLTCLGATAIMAPNMALTGAATVGLAYSTSQYFMSQFTETTP